MHSDYSRDHCYTIDRRSASTVQLVNRATEQRMPQP
jgi:hypothetical protein